MKLLTVEIVRTENSLMVFRENEEVLALKMKNHGGLPKYLRFLINRYDHKLLRNIHIL